MSTPETPDEYIVPTMSDAAPASNVVADDARRNDVIQTQTFLSTSDKMRFRINLLLAVIASGAAFTALQRANTSICCGDYDGYYHIRWSRLLWENFKGGHILPPEFTWLPLTTLNPRDYVDHHYLFHILQIPYTWFGDLATGAKVASVVFATLAVTACFWLLARYCVRYPLVWLIALLASSSPFLYRMSMAKAPPLSIVLTVAGAYLLFEHKYKWLAPLAFVFVWTYSLFPLLLLAAFLWGAILLWSEDKIEWRPLAFSFGGALAGFVVNPYFPKNFRLFFEHILIKAGGFTVGVGNEWYPYDDTWYFWSACVVAFVAMGVGYIAFDWRNRREAKLPLFFLIFSTILMIACFKQRRWVEYWPPFAVLFAAFSLNALWLRTRASLFALPDEMQDLAVYLDRDAPETTANAANSIWWDEAEIPLVALLVSWLLFVIFNAVTGNTGAQTGSRLQAALTIKVLAAEFVVAAIVIGYVVWRGWQRGVGLLGTVILGAILFGNIGDNRASIQGDAGHDYYQGGMAWVKQNVPPGQMIFNTDWDDFPRLFYFDPTHAYVTGLDPTYLFDKNPELSKLYEDITLGRTNEAAPLIRERFNAQYVFTDNRKEHDDFTYKALNSGWVDKVYDDADCTVLKIRDQKGVSPDEMRDNDKPALPDSPAAGDNADDDDNPDDVPDDSDPDANTGGGK